VIDPRNARIFVRNDDVGARTEALTRFVRLFLDRRIPVSYQVIPAKLTRECADWLRELWREHPDLIEFGQHGLNHEMILRGQHLLREFGPERDLPEQMAIVAEGRSRLQQMMGADIPIRVFTPPQHKYDRNTVKAVTANGFEIFSAAAYPSPHHRLAYAVGRMLGRSSIRHHGISHHESIRPEAPIRELSIAIAVDDGRRLQVPAGRLPMAIARAAKTSRNVGLMFHHEVYASRPDELERLADTLASLAPGRLALLGQLALEQTGELPGPIA
jgi:hypothetical protein